MTSEDRGVHPKGGRVTEQWPLQDHLTARFWGEILQHCGSVPDRLPPEELLLQYLGLERRDPEGSKVSGTHRHSHPSLKEIPGEQEGLSSAMAGPRKRLWFHAPQAVTKHWAVPTSPRISRTSFRTITPTLAFRSTIWVAWAREGNYHHVPCCTILIILFTLAMNMLRSAEVQ